MLVIQRDNIFGADIPLCIDHSITIIFLSQHTEKFAIKNLFDVWFFRIVLYKVQFFVN